ncbi:hypothetical protein C3941_13640 [Kaistia algarum]|uniref:hypothetical protein n=1 Tax=Kaistia algarum TaxID=2083279 RepID=UPI000CE788A3|nr:hypothetical protein [Kaistia algarum]MCX5513742.1 hypothetical protein [Kaistia algarum]PPE79387.1 hypothetical protein C3941_13640 [Kaistia algarum]
MPETSVYVFCVDVGSPRNVGWADNEGETGGPETFAAALFRVALRLQRGELVALGFEAPIWTPRRSEFARITSSRGGAELVLRRAWSAGAGCGALGAALALMPWCFSALAVNGVVPATTSVERFRQWNSGLFVWEALVTGEAKGTDHHHDASYAVEAFVSRLADLQSDVPAEPAINHAAVALMIAGFPIALEELTQAGLVIAAVPRTIAILGGHALQPAPVRTDPKEMEG